MKFNKNYFIFILFIILLGSLVHCDEGEGGGETP